MTASDRITEFDLWMFAVEAYLSECGESLEDYPCSLHTWFDLWDYDFSPEYAVFAVEILAQKIHRT